MQDISIFDLFSIGIGPSSSHTVGPMTAAHHFRQGLLDNHLIDQLDRINVELFGSLAFTGKGHGTDKAICLGLNGQLPDRVDPEIIPGFMQQIADHSKLAITENKTIEFDLDTHLIFDFDNLLPEHNNGMRFSAFDSDGRLLLLEVSYSIGGGFVLYDNEQTESTSLNLPHQFETAAELTALCQQHNKTIAEIMMDNELCFQSKTEIKSKLDRIIDIMQASIHKSCETEGILPGGLNVKRRAAKLYAQLNNKGKPDSHQSMDSMDWLNLYAIAVNEANAAGDQVVTAPTNGAAGIIPAVMTYYEHFYSCADKTKLHDFLLTAGTIALLYKKRASISGAEVGCQGEVGVASSMAAAALTAVLGGTIDQICNAAEIAMEHHLGMTCDPIGGLVQIPCIERNAMGSVKAVNSSRLALLGEGDHFVSLDDVIKTMKQTGDDMHQVYKETSKAGLAVNVVEC